MAASSTHVSIGDWVALGLQAGQITKVNASDQFAVLISGKQYWRRSADLRPLFGKSGVPKLVPEVGDWVRLPAADERGASESEARGPRRRRRTGRRGPRAASRRARTRRARGSAAPRRRPCGR